VKVEEIPICVDSRERLPFHFGPEVPTVVCCLPAGDYSSPGYELRVAIERKSLQDLTMCCGAERARFVRELERLSRYERAAIVVEA